MPILCTQDKGRCRNTGPSLCKRVYLFELLMPLMLLMPLEPLIELCA